MKGGESVELCKHGISTNTPENILFGAGVYYKNLMWDSTNKRWTGVCLGATSGGGSVSIGKDIHDLELDGALVPVKGNAIKQGGLATMKVSIAEITKDNLQSVTLFEAAEADGLKFLQDKADIVEGDYLNNLAFVGKTIKGGNIIVIFEKALCTSGMETETENKDKSVLTAEFECYAGITGDLNVLPVKIYRSTVAGEFEPDIPEVASMYSYNGTVLPDINTVYTEAVKASHPFAMLCYNIYGTLTLQVITVRPYYNGENMAIPTAYGYIIYIVREGEWSLYYRNDDAWATNSHALPFWTNFDLLAEDGSVYLAKTEPIPIYE